MLTRAVAALTAALAVTAAGAAPAAAAGTTPPASCGAAGYPVAYGIWCPGTIHVVTAGETLQGLARQDLGSSRLWPEIYIVGSTAPRRCGSTAASPGPVRPGEVLIIPDAAAQVSAPPWCEPGTWPARPGSAAAAAAGPRAAWPAWMLYLAVAAAVLFTAGAAVTLATRRHGTRSRQAAGPAAGQPQPSGYPRAGAGRPRGVVLAAAGPGRDAPPYRVWSPALGTGGPDAARRRGEIPVGIRDQREAVADLAALGGLGLTGPGAEAAARALLASVLALTRPAPAGLPAPVIVPAGTGLLPLPAGPAGTLLAQPPTLDAALDQAESLASWLARPVYYGDPDDDVPVVPAALFAVPGPDSKPRLRDIAAAGQELGIIVVTLGPWYHGVTADVAEDGTVMTAIPAGSALDGVRLFQVTPRDLAAVAAAVLAPAAGRETAGPGPRPAGPAPEAGSGPPVTVSVLGPLRISAGQQEISSGVRKARELIAYLAACGPDGASAGAVAEALWPGATPGSGERQRKLAVRKARDLLRGHTGGTAAMWIQLSAGRYRLDPDLISADLWQFATALDTARSAGTDPDRLAAYRQAASLCRGELCEGAGYDWAEPYAEAARRSAVDTWIRIAEILQPADPDQAIAALEAALGHDRYSEDTYLRIMRLQAAAGRPDAARRTYQFMLARLQDLELTGPRPAVRRAAAELLGDSGPQPVMNGHTAARDGR